MRQTSFRIVVPLLLALSLFALAPAAKTATGPLPGNAPADAFLGHYDVRVLGKTDLARIAEAYGAPVRRITASAQTLGQSMRKGAARLETAAPGVRIEPSPIGGGIEVVSAAGTPLTPAAPDRDGAAIVLGFLRTHGAVYGLAPDQVEHLEIQSESRSPGGARTVYLRQTVGGLGVEPFEAILASQGTLRYDSNADGTNDADAVTDDPTTHDRGDATRFVVSKN